MASPAQIAANPLNRSEDRGCQVHERHGSKFGAHDSFGPGEGLDDRLRSADVIDPDGVEQHGDLTSEMGEISVNAPSEANIDETISSVEPRSLSKLARALRNQ